MMGTFMLMMIPRAAVCAERIAEVLDTESSVVPPDAPVTETPSHGEVEFRDVSFAYPGAAAPVLRGISFTAAPGHDHRRSSAAPAPARRRCCRSSRG